MATTTVEVQIDLDDLDEDVLVEYLKDHGYYVGDKPLEEDDDEEEKKDDSDLTDYSLFFRAKDVATFINNNGDDSLLKEVLYEYLGMGYFNEIDALCDELKRRLK